MSTSKLGQGVSWDIDPTGGPDTQLDGSTREHEECLRKPTLKGPLPCIGTDFTEYNPVFDGGPFYCQNLKYKVCNHDDTS